MSVNQIGDVYWLGQFIEAKVEVGVELGGLSNNPVVTGRKVKRGQRTVAGKVTATVTYDKGLKLRDSFSASDEGELQIHWDGGDVQIWEGAFIQDRPHIKGGESGGIDITWAIGEETETRA